MPRVDPVRRVVFIRTDRLGETLLNLPVIASLKAALPHAVLTLLVQTELAPLMARAPGVNHVLAVGTTPGTWWMRALALSRLLQPCRFDLAVVSNPMKELHAAVWLAGIPLRVGYDRKWGFLLTHRLPDRKALGERHEAAYNLDLLRALGLPVVASTHWQLPRFEREEVEVQHLLEQQGLGSADPFIAIHPWTSNPRKQWPLDRFERLIQLIVERLQTRVVLIGGKEEAGHLQRVAPPSGRVADLVGRCSLTQLAALLQRARLLVSNDSGPVHLAAAVGTPTVVLFGSEHPGTGPTRWGPWGQGHSVIWKPSMDEIVVEEVFEAVRAHVG